MLIVGAGGAAKDLVAMLELEYGEPELIFYDDVNLDGPEKLFGKYQILRSKEAALDYFRTDPRFVVAVGLPPVRERMQRQFEGWGAVPTSVISSHSRIGNYNRISERGVIIMHNVTITNDVMIAEGCLINMGVTLGHGATVGKFCELSPDVYFSSCVLGDRCHMGIGVTLVPGIQVGDDVTAGVGAVITKNIPSGRAVMGVPAR